MPYALGVALAVMFYGLSKPYRKYISPTLPEPFGGLLSGMLAVLTVALMEAVKRTILTDLHVEQDDLVCMETCYRFSDTPLVAVLAFLFVRRDMSFRRKS